MGYTIAEHLALHRSKVWMGARSESSAKDAIQIYERTHSDTKNRGQIVWLPLDLTSPRDVANLRTYFSLWKKDWISSVSIPYFCL